MRLCEYSLPEGATISALFEPDVNINIEVSTGHRTQKFTVSNAISVMAFKTQICDVFKHAVQLEAMKLRCWDDIVDQNLPLHFYGITDGSKLEVIRPYVGVRIENNHGNKIYWRLYRKDTIKEVKVKLASANTASLIDTTRTFSFLNYKSTGQSTGQISNKYNEVKIDGVSIEGTFLYLIKEDRSFDELDDDETVENCKIKDGNNLYLLTYRWTDDEGDVIVLKTGTHTWGVEPGDTCLGIKLKVQDQKGIPASDLTLFKACGGYQVKSYFEGNRRKIGIADKSIPFYVKDLHLVAITEEELHAEAVSIEEERRRRNENTRKHN